MVTNIGHFVSIHRTAGAFRVVVRVFHHGHAVNRCDTGPVTWSATRH